MKLSVIGTGYLGAVHAACMAELGFDVVGIDVDEAKISTLKAGKAPGILTGVEADAKHWLEVGALFVAVGADVGILARESEKLLAKFRA